MITLKKKKNQREVWISKQKRQFFFSKKKKRAVTKISLNSFKFFLFFWGLFLPALICFPSSGRVIPGIPVHTQRRRKPPPPGGQWQIVHRSRRRIRQRLVSVPYFDEITVAGDGTAVRFRRPSHRRHVGVVELRQATERRFNLRRRRVLLHSQHLVEARRRRRRRRCDRADWRTPAEAAVWGAVVAGGGQSEGGDSGQVECRRHRKIGSNCRGFCVFRRGVKWECENVGTVWSVGYCELRWPKKEFTRVYIAVKVGGV